MHRRRIVPVVAVCASLISCTAEEQPAKSAATEDAESGKTPPASEDARLAAESARASGSATTPSSASDATSAATARDGAANPVPSSARTAGAPDGPWLDPESPAGTRWKDHVGDVRFVLGSDAGRTLAREQSKPAMFFVTTTWCRYCRLMASENFRDPAIETLLERFVCVLVDADSEPDAARGLGAVGYPHVRVTTSAGGSIDEVSGAQPSGRFRVFLERALAAAIDR